MQTLNELEAAPAPLEEEQRRHTWRLVAGLLCALILTGALSRAFLYLLYLHQRNQHDVATATETAGSRTAVTPKVEVFVDEPTLNGKKTLLGGAIHNISNESLHNVAVELELKRRGSGTLETRTVTPDQTELPPDGTARYSLEVLAQDYLNGRFVRVVAGDNRAEVPFKAQHGAPRPPMPTPPPKTIIVNRPASRGGEFLNSPDKPERVP